MSETISPIQTAEQAQATFSNRLVKLDPEPLQIGSIPLNGATLPYSVTGEITIPGEFAVGKRRLALASNRLPVEFHRDEETGTITARPTVGGLKTSVERVFQNGEYEGIWIGSTNLTTDEIEGLDEALGPDLNGNHTEYVLVPINESLYDLYYRDDANGQKWMYLHEMSEFAQQYLEEGYQASRQVNGMFAETILSNTSAEDIVWVQDYHLPYVGEEMLRLGQRRDTIYYLHIAFGHPDKLAGMPRLKEFVNGLTTYDVIGFQDPRFLRNFIETVRRYGDFEEIKDTDQGILIKRNGRYSLAATYPISIDTAEYEDLMEDPEVLAKEQEHRKDLPPDAVLITGGSRMGPSKAIVELIEGVDHTLEHYPLMRGVLFLDRVVAQGRNLEIYNQQRRQVDNGAGAVNRKYRKSYPQRPAVRILPKTDKRGIVGLFRAGNIIEAASRADGRNLTADEGPLVNERNAVLFLGEFTGAAYNLGDYAVLVNPLKGNEHYSERLVYAATMPEKERAVRMAGLKRTVRGHNVFDFTEDNLRGLQFVKRLNRDLQTVA